MKKRQSLDSIHDNSYASLFTHPRLVKDLLRGFLPADWVRQLDFRTLEKVNPIYVYVQGKKVKKRSDDIVWKMRWGQEK